jgi:hypothetical protein
MVWALLAGPPMISRGCAIVGVDRLAARRLIIKVFFMVSSAIGFCTKGQYSCE